MTADLHIHTTASDGRLTPQEIVAQAVQAGLNYIAITDHDTVAGIKVLQQGGLQQGELSITAGIELSADLPDYEVHILGYGIDTEHPVLNHALEGMIQDRYARIGRMIAKLNHLGYDIGYDEVMELAGASVSVGRPLLARALVEKGFFNSVTDVFTKLLYKNGPAYVPHLRLKPEEIIQLIKKTGGIPVLAHPGLIGSRRIVNEMITAGVCGLEVYHPKHSKEQVTEYSALAHRNHLLVTGGSDYHAIPSRFPDKLGVFTVPDALATGVIHAIQALNQ
jgi:predicted metal-dependent phosphoesterase TrpH